MAAAAAVAAAVKKRVKLGSVGLEVSAQGLGFRFSWPGKGPFESDTYLIKLIHHAINSGVTFIDTSQIWGPPLYEFFIRKALKGGFREKVQLASKVGLNVTEALTGRSNLAYLRNCCERSLKRLHIDCIDLYYAAHIEYNDTVVPIEATMGELKKLVEEGKIKYVGLLDASASTIRRAHAVHPITAVQTEWSMWSRDLEAEIVPTCRELGIGIVPYSPLRCGFFTACFSFSESVSDKDFRKNLLSLSEYGESMERREMIFKRISEMATRKGCTLSQLGLAWVHYQGDDVVPIPVAATIGHFNHNIGALSVKLTRKEMKELKSYSLIDVVEFNDEYLPYNFINSKTPRLSSWKA